jgi:tetratricopeptide (TPR) repeat protein
LWAQKYEDLPEYTTLIQKKVSFLSRRLLALALILLPLWALGANRPGKKISNDSVASPRPSPQQADSLFAAGRYAAAMPTYKQLVWQQRRASPELLLKMAYAQQQLGHHPAALLYLNLAQAREPRVRTWRQLAALAAQHRLVGYPLTWQQELRVRAQRYYYPGLQVLLGGAVVAAIWLLWRRGSRRAWLALGVYTGLLGVYLHVLRPKPAGLVARAGAALMAGPSAGAPWLSTAAVGDRLLVLGRQDIWYRVEWQQRVAFVREADLLVVE